MGEREKLGEREKARKRGAGRGWEKKQAWGEELIK